MNLLLALALLSAAPDWRPVSAETSAITDAEALDALAADFPNSATIQRRRLIATFQAGDEPRARDALDRLAAMRVALAPESYAMLAGLVGEEAAEGYAARARWNRQPLLNSIWPSQVSTDIRLVEGVAADPVERRTLVGSVVDRGLFHISARGEWKRLPVEGLGSVFGLAADPERGIVWAASGAVEQTPDPHGAFVGLVAVEGGTGREQRRVAAPPGVRALNDLAVAPNGDVLVTDATGASILRLRAGADSFETLVPAGQLRGPQGIAIAPDGRRAYLADWGYGIAILDLETGALARLEAPDHVVLDGVDGLLFHENSLFALHNGIRPMRITQLPLAADGRSVLEQVTRERAHPAWGEITLGVITHGGLTYVADAQWERFGEGGKLKGEAPLRPTRLGRIVLDLP